MGAGLHPDTLFSRRSKLPLDQSERQTFFGESLCSTDPIRFDQLEKTTAHTPLMPRISKIELSPDNGCVIDMKWTLGPLSYHASGAGKVTVEPNKEIVRLPELVLYDHVG